MRLDDVLAVLDALERAGARRFRSLEDADEHRRGRPLSAAE